MPLFLLRGKPGEIGTDHGKLKPCPTSPNCVCSDSIDPPHRVAPLKLTGGASADAWPQVEALVRAMPRTSIVTVSDNYLHAECTSPLLGFVDDLELCLRAVEGIIAVRSASRSGYYDFGVNRRRVEQLRTLLRSKKIAV